MRTMLRCRPLVAACAGVVLSVATTAFAGETYRVTPLGEFVATGLSDAGQVSGVGGSFLNAVLYDGGTLRDLGTLAPPGQNAMSAAFGINPAGVVVGASSLGDAGETHAFVYAGGSLVDIDQRPGYTYSVGVAINGAGHATGYASFDSLDSWHAMLYRDGSLLDLGSLDGYAFSQGNGINGRDQVVGFAMTGDFTTSRAIFHDGTSLHDLGTLGGPFSAAGAINDAGTIVGTSDTADGHRHGFVWQDGVMRDIGTLGGNDTFAGGIDADGTIFGTSTLSDGSARAFMLDGGVMTDLNALLAPGSDPGCTLDAVYGFNARGQIGAACSLANGLQSVFLLTPVPEPAAAVLMALGIAGLGVARRRALSS